MKVLSYGWVLALHAGPGGVWLDGRVWEGRGGRWVGGGAGLGQWIPDQGRRAQLAGMWR